MENVVEMCQYILEGTLPQYIAILDKRFYSYITIESEMFGVFAEIDKKYNLKGETHTQDILDQILEDCEFK